MSAASQYPHAFSIHFAPLGSRGRFAASGTTDSSVETELCCEYLLLVLCLLVCNRFGSLVMSDSRVTELARDYYPAHSARFLRPICGT